MKLHYLFPDIEDSSLLTSKEKNLHTCNTETIYKDTKLKVSGDISKTKITEFVILIHELQLDAILAIDHRFVLDLCKTRLF